MNLESRSKVLFNFLSDCYTVNQRHVHVYAHLRTCICTLTLGRFLSDTAHVFSNLSFSVSLTLQEKLSEDQKESAISEVPSLLAICGQTYYFGTFLAGPQVNTLASKIL